jgi:hypothetical protein
VTTTNDTDDIVTLTRMGELTTAQLLCGRLEAEGIESFLPDQVMAAQTWHLNRAIGGIRVQVRQADLERARMILAQPCEEIEATADHAGGNNGVDDDGSISVDDRAAFRALRVALVSVWLMGLVHPYSLWLAFRALGRPGLTAWGRKRARIALLISLAGCIWNGLLALHWAKRAG